MSLSENIDENIRNIEAEFFNCYDISFRDFLINEGKTRCSIVYIAGIVDNDTINESILKPLMTSELKSLSEDFGIDCIVDYIGKSVASISGVKSVKEMSEAVGKLIEGYCILFVDKNSNALALDTEGWNKRETGEANVEPVLRGSTESFVESIKINTALLRKRIKTTKLKLERMEIGRISKTTVIVSYIDGIADAAVVQEIKSRLKRIDIDYVMESGNIEHFIDDNPLSPYPLIEYTERPDSSAFALTEGRIVILTDGSPFVLIAPTVFSHFFVSAEDNYAVSYFAPFIIIIRYLAYLISLLAPSAFIAMTTYHPEMIPYQLLQTLVAARSELPFPILLEALLMEITFELLREAGERLPRQIGASLSIVGALVIGQAAIQSGLVSPAMVVIIAGTATASFVNPKLNMSRSVRVLRFPFMFLAAFLGLFGLVMGILSLLILLISLRSVGVPYMTPFAPLKFGEWKTLILKFPLWLSNKRPSSIQKNNIVRTANTKMQKPPGNKE